MLCPRQRKGNRRPRAKNTDLPFLISRSHNRCAPSPTPSFDLAGHDRQLVRPRGRQSPWALAFAPVPQRRTRPRCCSAVGKIHRKAIVFSAVASFRLWSFELLLTYQLIASACEGGCARMLNWRSLGKGAHHARLRTADSTLACPGLFWPESVSELFVWVFKLSCCAS